MISCAPPLSFVSEFFQDFYYEVLRQQERVLSGNWRLHSVDLGPVESQEDMAVENMLLHLEGILQAQSLQANQEGGSFGVACYCEAQYIMAVLADEIFLNLPWEGKGHWESHLLEERIFKTHIAGEKFFESLEGFLKERNPLKNEIGILYLTCLGLGFRGKYRGRDEGDIIANYKKQLFHFIYRHPPQLFKSTPLLFSQPYDHTLEGDASRGLSRMKKWRRFFALTISVYVVLSYVSWSHVTYNLSRLTVSVLQKLEKIR